MDIKWYICKGWFFYLNLVFVGKVSLNLIYIDVYGMFFLLLGFILGIRVNLLK